MAPRTWQSAKEQKANAPTEKKSNPTHGGTWQTEIRKRLQQGSSSEPLASRMMDQFYFLLHLPNKCDKVLAVAE
jgi:hypothetical protein